MLAVSADNPAVLARSLPLPRPARGDATRVRVGSAEIVLERTRGGDSLLWSDGREARRYVLGLHDSGQLSLELRAPRLPLCAIPREVLTLVPGARLRGYVMLPLVPTVVWRDRLRPPETLIELLPATLEAQWDERHGHSFRCAVSWLTRFPFPSGSALAVAPLVLRNRSAEVVCPGRLDVAFGDNDVHELRGALVLEPRRIVWPEAGRHLDDDARNERHDESEHERPGHERPGHERHEHRTDDSFGVTEGGR